VTVLELSELPIDICIIDFAGAGLVAAGDVGDMNEADHVDILLQFFDKIALGDLFVEEVIEELNLRVVDGAHDVNGLGG